jgi:hypothetical protein
MFRVWNQPSPVCLAAIEVVRDTQNKYGDTFADPNIPKVYLIYIWVCGLDWAGSG